MPLYPGDPLTPGVGATSEAKRLALADAQSTTRIPVLPISYGDAQPLLAALRGPINVKGTFKNPKVLVKPATGEPYTIPAAREITIKHLLNHTSGIVYHWNPDLGQRYRDANVAHGLLQYDGTIADSVKRLAAQLSNAAVVGKKIVSWEVPYFYSPLAGEKGIQLRQQYLASLAAGDRN